MNHEAISQIFFEDRHTVLCDETARRRFRVLADGGPYAQRLVEAMATSALLTLVESLCLRELDRFVEPECEAIVGRKLDVAHLAPVPAGASLRISGWVQGLCEREVIFRVQVYDEHETVCDSTIGLVVVRRAEFDRRLGRKSEAIARRNLFLAA